MSDSGLDIRLIVAAYVATPKARQQPHGQQQLVRIPWRSAERADRRIEQCKSFISDFKELVSAVDESDSEGQAIQRHRDEIDTESRVREAGVAELREETKKLSSLIDGYVGKLDASGREGA